MENEKSRSVQLHAINNDRLEIILRKGEITVANKQSFLVSEIKILLKWKQCKNMSGNKAELLNRYFETPDPEEITPWSDLQEQELLTLQDNGIEMKDTAVAVSMKRNVVYNNINLLNTPEKTRLIQTLNQEEEI